MSMRIGVLLAVLISCGVLTACDKKPVTTCIAEGNVGLPEERMNEVDKFFLTTDFASYLGVPVSKLERDFVIKFRERTASTKEPAELQWIDYKFRGDYKVRVFLSDLKYVKVNSKTGRWDFSKLGKESITGINVTHSGAGDFYYCKDYGAIRL